MAEKVPQYTDFQINFKNVQFNLEPVDIDLSAVDDIIFSMAKGRINATPTLNLRRSVSPVSFTVDNETKTVSVKIGDAYTQSIGKFYVNLWLVIAGEYVTHLTQNFDIVPVVKYE